jgi:PA14 domain
VEPQTEPRDIQGIAAEEGVIGDLFESARVLLNRGGDIDAVHVLHLEIARSRAEARAVRLPPRYSSLAEARAYHAQLLAEGSQERVQPSRAKALRALFARRPEWSIRLAVAILAAGLTLRYAWAVSMGKNWARQNPEGNWVSRFYTNASFQGFPLVRYDVGVNHDFGSRGPADSAPKDGFSARWDTCIVVTKDVVVLLQLHSDDSSKLFLDGQLQFEVESGPGQTAASLSLHPGVRHVRVEFVERAGMALIRLDGLEPDGNGAYSFRRPVIDGNEVHCQ